MNRFRQHSTLDGITGNAEPNATVFRTSHESLVNTVRDQESSRNEKTPPFCEETVEAGNFLWKD
jgi:uncharacterized protein YbcV (DUF1398 family)